MRTGFGGSTLHNQENHNIGYYLCLDPGVARYVILLLLLLLVLLHSSTIHPIVEADLILPHPFMNASRLELETNLCEV